MKDFDANEAAKYFEIFCNLTSAAVIIMDRDANIIDANPALAEMIGYEKEDLVGASFHDFSIKTQMMRDRVKENPLQYLLMSESSVFEVEFYDKHSQPVPVSLRSFIFRDVNNQPEIFETKAISMKQALNKSVSRRQILQSFLQAFEHRIETIDSKSVIDEWKTMTSTIGSQVRIETLGDVFEGRALDVDDSGALIIETKNEKIRKIIYGDCFHDPTGPNARG